MCASHEAVGTWVRCGGNRYEHLALLQCATHRNCDLRHHRQQRRAQALKQDASAAVPCNLFADQIAVAHVELHQGKQERAVQTPTLYRRSKIMLQHVMGRVQ